MRFGKPTGALAVAFTLVIPALTPAEAAPFAAEAVRIAADNAAPVHKVGYRDGKYRKFHGGISYVGPYGLKYAPDYRYRRHHGHDISVKIYIGPRKGDDYRRRTRALIIDLPN